MRKKNKLNLIKFYLLFTILKLARLLLNCLKRFVHFVYNKMDWKIYRNNISKIDRKAEKWARYNQWFGDDIIMTNAAFSIHRELVEFEGMDPKSNRYYNEIDKRIYDKFKHKIKRYYSMDN